MEALLLHSIQPIMLLNSTVSAPLRVSITTRSLSSTKTFVVLNAYSPSVHRSRCRRGIIQAIAVSSVLILSSSRGGLTAELKPTDPPKEAETFSNIPQTLSGSCLEPKDCKKARIQRPKNRTAESCTVNCLTTCIRGGEGSPGEGPLNIRRPIVVFKQGFRSRRYCLTECSDICNLMGGKTYAP